MTNPEDLLRKRLGSSRYRQVERTVKKQKLLDTAPRAAQYQGFQVNSGAIVRTVGDGVRAVAPVSNGLVASGDNIRVVGDGVSWKPRVELPVEEEVKEEEYYPFKVLFSVKEEVEGKEVLAFYLGGDRKAPLRLFDVNKNSTVMLAALHNYGKIFKVFVSVSDANSASRRVFIVTNSGKQDLSKINLPLIEATPVESFFYIGDGKYNLSFIHPGYTSSVSPSGGYCDIASNTIYRSTDGTIAPLSFSGNGNYVTIGDGRQNEYCRTFSLESNTRNNIVSANIFIDSLKEPKVNICNSTKTISSSWKRGTDMIQVGNFNFFGKIADGIYSKNFQYSNEYRWRSNGANAALTVGNASEKFSITYPFFCGLSYFFEQKVSINLLYSRDNYEGLELKTNIQRSAYSNEIILRKNDTPEFRQPIFQDWKGLFFISESEIDLNEDSKVATLSHSNIQDYISYSYFNYTVNRTQEGLSEFINSYVGSKVVVNKKRLTAKGVITSIEFTMNKYSEDAFFLADIFRINVALKDVSKKEFLSFTNEEGLLYTDNDSLQCFVIRNLHFKNLNSPKLLFMSSSLEITMLTGFSLYYLTYNAVFSLLTDYTGNIEKDKERVKVYFYKEFNTIINNSSFIEKNIYYPPLNIKSYNAFNSVDFSYFEDIKAKSAVKFCDKWTITEEGKIVQQEAEKGMCLSLNSPNCTIHAVSYCPKSL